MNYGINYMGSKNTIASEICQHILNAHPDRSVFIDACAGGFAVSHYVLRNTTLDVYANDINEHVMSLYHQMLTHIDPNYDKFKGNWISRERFKDVVDNTAKYDKQKWFVGNVMSTWTFGGQQESYLYAKDKEEIKKALHNLIVYGHIDPSLEAFAKRLSSDVIKAPYTPNKRITILSSYSNYAGEQMQVEHLSRFERLLELEKDLTGSKRIHLHTMDYMVFVRHLLSFPDLMKKAVIYFDPPYEGTATYAHDSLVHSEFWDLFMSLKDVVPCYASSYQSPVGTIVWQNEKIVGVDINRSRAVERLFYNNYTNKQMSLSDLLGVAF